MATAKDRLKTAVEDTMNYGAKDMLRDSISAPDDEGGGYSASRAIMLGGAVLLVGLALAALVGIAFFGLEWDPVSGVYEFLKDLYLYMVGAYSAGKIGRGIGHFRDNKEKPLGE